MCCRKRRAVMLRVLGMRLLTRLLLLVCSLSLVSLLFLSRCGLNVETELQLDPGTGKSSRTHAHSTSTQSKCTCWRIPPSHVDYVCCRLVFERCLTAFGQTFATKNKRFKFHLVKVEAVTFLATAQLASRFKNVNYNFTVPRTSVGNVIKKSSHSESNPTCPNGRQLCYQLNCRWQHRYTWCNEIYEFAAKKVENEMLYLRNNGAWTRNVLAVVEAQACWKS
jgi:hypothetical protein